MISCVNEGGFGVKPRRESRGDLLSRIQVRAKADPSPPFAKDATGFGMDDRGRIGIARTSEHHTPRTGSYLADVSVPAGSPTALRYSITSEGIQIFSSKI
jgi:hypothetical protein